MKFGKHKTGAAGRARGREAAARAEHAEAGAEAPQGAGADPAEAEGDASDATPAGAAEQAAARADAPAASAQGGEASAPAAAPDPGQLSAEFKDKWLRALAEAENVRRSARQDLDAARRYGSSSLLVGLLGALDDLQRALAAPPEGIDPAFLDGLKLVEQRFMTALATAGVSRVPAAPGQAPDPMAHLALLEQPSDQVPPGTILTVVLPGYRLHDRLLREAQVVVARAPDAPPPSDGAPPPEA